MALLSLDGRPISEAGAHAILQAVAHRGDGRPRLWLGEGVALGHANRPTTLEAEAEQLPASDATGRYRITWDGRLDNRGELAGRLGIATTALCEMTDADLVVAAYARWGERCTGPLLGDWALAIWDAEARRLFCARDPIGMRPLFYRRGGGLLAVGSEPQQLFAGRMEQPRVNREFVLRALAGAVQDPGTTCFDGVHELEDGQRLSAGEHGVAVRRYWSSPAVRDLPYERPEQYAEEFAELFERATRARLRSNRRVAIHLSGGLDSSYVCASAAQLGADVRALTMYTPGSATMDERPYARLVAQRLGMPHTEVDVSDCWALSGRWVPDAVFDDPMLPPQAPHMIRSMVEARELGCEVVLNGDGGDEWMDGERVQIADAMLRGRPRTAWRLAHLTRPSEPAPRTLVRSLVEAFVPPSLRETIVQVRAAASGSRREEAPLVDAQAGWVSPRALESGSAWWGHDHQWTTWRIYRHVTRPTVAWRDRHALARTGVELRSSFNDLRVVELMASTPEWMKRFRGRRRDLLREAGQRVLPAAVINRRGKGHFNELVIEGLSKRERERVIAAAHVAASFAGVRTTAALKEVTKDGQMRLTEWGRTWRLVAAGLWLRYVEELRRELAGSHAVDVMFANTVTGG